jgi:hypothetical protein
VATRIVPASTSSELRRNERKKNNQWYEFTRLSIQSRPSQFASIARSIENKNKRSHRDWRDGCMYDSTAPASAVGHRKKKKEKNGTIIL